MMNFSERMKLLQDTPVFWSRLGIGYDPPMRDEQGRWLLFSRDFEKYRYLHKSFYDIGVKVHSAVIPNGWFGVDDYFYKYLDEHVVITEEATNIIISCIRRLNEPLSSDEEMEEYMNRTYNGLGEIGAIKKDFNIEELISMILLGNVLNTNQ